jgi:hypothetical protein
MTTGIEGPAFVKHVRFGLGEPIVDAHLGLVSSSITVDYRILLMLAGYRIDMFLEVYDVGFGVR